MQVSIIIVSWNVAPLLRHCLEALRIELEECARQGKDGREFAAEVFVVDNCSADDSVAMVTTEHPWVHLIANGTNRGFAAANNQAIRLARGKYILLLNPDTEIRPGALQHLISFLERNPRAGVAAPQLLNSDGSVQRSCREFPTFVGMLYELLGLSRLFPGHAEFGRYKMLDFQHDHEREVDQPEGACLLIRREVLREVGDLDEGYFMLFEEVDWCFRVKQAGWQIWFTPHAQVVHHYGQSIKQVKAKMILSSHRGLYRYWTKHLCRGRWYMKGIVYAGLMTLALLRVCAHLLRGKQAIAASPSVAVSTGASVSSTMKVAGCCGVSTVEGVRPQASDQATVESIRERAVSGAAVSGADRWK